MKYCCDGGSHHSYDENKVCFDCGLVMPVNTKQKQASISDSCDRHSAKGYQPHCGSCRVIKHRAEAAAQGRKRKEYLVSDDEHVKLKAYLRELRGL